jgi:hypothetical protein
MGTEQSNPLVKFFRQPGIFLKLPSKGRWWEEGTLELPAIGELAVYPMTTKDEILLRTPDALMNGQGVVDVIQSCCPSIKDPWKMPTVDLDPVLIAIRIATYGKQMDFTAVCPHCGTKNEHAIDLGVMLEKVKAADWSKHVSIDGLEIILKPQSYEDYNKNNMLNFEEQRIIQLVSSQDISDEEKTEQFDVMFRRLIDTGINQVSKSIAGIRLEDGTVVENPEFIREFLDNCDKRIWDLIKDRLDEIRKDNNFNQVNLVCTNEECAKEFTTPFVFEQTNFFG